MSDPYASQVSAMRTHWEKAQKKVDEADANRQDIQYEQPADNVTLLVDRPSPTSPSNRFARGRQWLKSGIGRLRRFIPRRKQ